MGASLSGAVTNQRLAERLATALGEMKEKGRIHPARRERPFQSLRFYIFPSTEGEGSLIYTGRVGPALKNGLRQPKWYQRHSA